MSGSNGEIVQGVRRPGQLRRAAQAMLVVLAGAYLWDLFQTLRFWGAPLFPPQMPVWLFLVIPWMFGPLPLAGVRLWLEARRRGGGRWEWRWWGGALPIALFLWFFTGNFAGYLAPPPGDAGGYIPWLGDALTVVAVVPLLMLHHARNAN